MPDYFHFRYFENLDCLIDYCVKEHHGLSVSIPKYSESIYYYLMDSPGSFPAICFKSKYRIKSEGSGYRVISSYWITKENISGWLSVYKNYHNDGVGIGNEIFDFNKRLFDAEEIAEASSL